MPKQTSALKKPSVRGSKSGRAIMALLDLLGRRWTLRILWELREQALTSRALRAVSLNSCPETDIASRQSAGNCWKTSCRCIALRSDGANVRPIDLNRGHGQAGAIGLHDSDPAAGGRIGTGDAPNRIVDPHRT